MGKKTVTSYVVCARWPAYCSTNERETEAPTPMWARRDWKSRILTVARRAFSLALVVLATCAGGYLAIVGYDQSRELSVGEIRMSVSPGHRGALDVYVPLVDWGARFEAIRAPIRHPRRPADRQPAGRDERRARASRSTSSRSATRRATRWRATSSG